MVALNFLLQAWALFVAVAAAAGTWRNCGQHPFAAQQPTASGQRIRSLSGWTKAEGPVVYCGYGDYNANTGPIDLAPYDPATGSFGTASELSAGTEAIYLFRPLLGRLFAPATDPKTSTGFSVYSPAATSWNDRAVFMEHAYDMNVLGSDLFLVGSGGDHLSRCLVSHDGGATWGPSLILTFDWDDYSRFYFAGTLGNKLYIQSSSNGTYSMAFDGTAWTMAPPIMRYGGRPVEFNGKMVILGTTTGGCSQLYSFDGINTPTSLFNGAGTVCGFDVFGSRLFVYSSSKHAILSTEDLQSWTTVAEDVPSDAISFTAIEGVAYVGLQNASLAVYSDPIWSEPSVVLLASVDTACLGTKTPAEIVVRRSGSTAAPLTVPIIAAGPAVSGVDFEPLPATVTIPAGARTATVLVTPLDDGRIKAMRTLFVKLGASTTATFIAGTPGETTVWITDNRTETFPPVRTAGAPSGELPYGTSQAELSLKTSSISECRHARAANTSFDGMADGNFTTEIGISHSAIVSGLVSGGRYTFYVRCKDAAGQANTDDMEIKFSVSATAPEDISAAAHHHHFIKPIIASMVLLATTLLL